MKKVETLIDVSEAFRLPPVPDDRSARVEILRRYRWSFDKTTATFHKDRFRMSAGVVRLLPLPDLDYSCAHPERVWT